MSDLIERDKAIDAIREHIKVVDGDDDALDYIATNMLKDVPSARPKGEWIVHEGGWKDLDYYPPKCKCNQCGYEEELYILNAKPTNFCPNCGARMKGADDE